jgi:hypothetical protein
MTHHSHEIKPPYTEEQIGLPKGAIRYESIDPQIPINDRQNYQRHIDDIRVQHSMKQPDVAQRIGLLAKRSYGAYFIIDGQHHTEAAIRLGINIMGYWVFDSDGVEHEKAVFNKFALWKAEQERKHA